MSTETAAFVVVGLVAACAALLAWLNGADKGEW